MAGMRARLAARLAVLGAATLGLSACYYDAGLGLGYYDDGYSYNSYDCDPYSPFDSYYDCDYRGGFYNIGYGGGWYQDYWYPGYGFYIFDRGGRRYSMYDNHRRYWGQRRHEWYRQHHGRQGGGQGWGYHDRDRRDGWRDGRHGRHDGDGRSDRWRGGDRRGATGADPNNGTSEAEALLRGQRRRGEGRGERRRGWQGYEGNAVPAPVTGQPEVAPPPGNWRRGRPPVSDGGGSRGSDGGRGNWQPPARQAPDVAQPAQPSQPAPAARSQGRAERILRGDGPRRQDD